MKTLSQANFVILFFAVRCIIPHVASAQRDTTPDPYKHIFTSERWCDDPGTACWWSPRDSHWFNGVRFIAEFDLRFAFQGGRNRVDLPSLVAIPKFAVEVNIYKSWVAAQFALTAPGRINVDSRSELNHFLRDSTSLATDGGFSYGLSFLNSAIAVGRGRVFYDRRSFKVEPCTQPSEHAAHLLEEGWRSQRDSSEARYYRLSTYEERQEAASKMQEIIREQDVARDSLEKKRQCVSRTQRRDSYWFVALQPVTTLRMNLKRGRDTTEARP